MELPKEHFQHTFFFWKKTAAEDRILIEIYDDVALSIKTCEYRFKCDDFVMLTINAGR